MYLLIFDFHTLLHMFIREAESALFVVLFLSERAHGLAIVFMRCWNMLILCTIEHGSLGIAKAPAVLGFIELLQILILDSIEADGGPRRLDGFESLLLPERDWRHTVPQGVR
jgi:hypothetical protein